MPRKKDVAITQESVRGGWRAGVEDVRQRIMKVAKEDAVLPQAMIGFVKWFALICTEQAQDRSAL